MGLLKAAVMSESAGNDQRAGTTLQLQTVLQRMAEKWQVRQASALEVLKEHWDEVTGEVWARTIAPEMIDKKGRLVVTVRSAPGVAMEIQRKGRRWRQILEGTIRVSGYEFTDVVLAPPYSLRRRTPRERTRGNE